MTRAEVLADDPIWLILIKVVVLFAFGVVMTLFMIWLERRVVARMQHRPGPNRVGPFGLLQSLADGLKLAFKEDIMPAKADKVVYFIAPVISTIPAFVAFSVMPFGGRVSIFGEQTYLQLVDLPVGVLVVLACSSLGVYGIVLAGWSSGSPYPLLGALRSAAQVISYEIAMGLSIVGVIITAHSLSTGDIVNAQANFELWGLKVNSFFIPLLPSFLIYVTSMVGETNRAPFDLPEAESELVGGFHTEYSSLKFALFFLAEYVNMVTVSAFSTMLFLGGGLFPFVGQDSVLNNGWLQFVWFIAKTFVLLFLFIWLRGTLPRYRYDQFMRLGWKVLVPVNLSWIVALVAVRQLRSAGWPLGPTLFFGAIAVLGLIALSFALPDREVPDDEYVPVTGGGYPIPPLDLEVPTETPKRRRQTRGSRSRRRAAVTAGQSASASQSQEGSNDGNV
ncbi:NADH-quinone oxidoreductase subunit NuoH [Labedaea rhizosphaerae]|uniref:NADH-quinone oxidoreductase subunit H n=1 Tax=Labedaea rhizosphaerae TaxID=598644 RepID=A0A4R6SQU4_LABRH|nr:NADH-quinone oxidoreductase subunit NuoH [Labedaea rhizosphaerae]TDQ05653.1 NADH dehydrogenase subunit H [Labedaea rhizosphaerae]